MTDETGAPAGGEAIAVRHPSARHWRRTLDFPGRAALSQQRRKPEAPVEQPEADPVEQPELAKASTLTRKRTPRSNRRAEPAEVPPIEPPRSWTQGRKGTLSILASRDAGIPAHSRTGTGTGFPPSQNEIAEQRKAFEAERQKAEQVRNSTRPTTGLDAADSEARVRSPTSNTG
jgi:hypothetical protein